MQNNDVDESNNFLINRKRENERKLKNDKISKFCFLIVILFI